MERSRLKANEVADVQPEFGAALPPELTPAFRLAGFVLGDYAEAEDALQESMLLAWRHWDELRDPSRLHAWFGQIVVNVCRGRLRRRRSGVVPLTGEEHSSEEDPFRAALARDAVGRALAYLNEDQRVVVVLRYWGSLTLPEIAERLGAPLGTVKSRHHYALLVMRKQLERERAEERA